MPIYQPQLVGPQLVNAVFKTHATHDEMASAKAGRAIYTEQEVCHITFPGNNKVESVFPAHEICEYQNQVTDYGLTRVPITYALKYHEQYMAFKNGGPQLTSGTPLEELTFLTQAKRLELKALKIYNAESLAALDGANLRMLGQGGRDLKNQAIDYIERAKSTATSTEVRNLKDEVERLKKHLEDQAKPRRGRPPVNAPDPFEDFQEVDILNWIAEAKPDHGLSETSSREELLAVAHEILAKHGKAKNKAA